MAKPPRSRRNRGTTEETQPADAAALLLGEGAGEATRPQVQAELADERDVIEVLRAEAGTGAYCRIWRRFTGEASESYVGRMDLSEYSMERVQEVYGGGDYKIDCRAIRDGKHHTIKVLRFTISHSIPAKHPLSGPAAAPAAVPAGTDVVELVKQMQAKSGGDGGVAAMMPMMMAMLQSQSQQMIALIQSMGKQNAPSSDPIVLELIRMNLANKPTPLAELAEGMALVRRMNKDSGSAKDDDDEPKGALDKVLDRLTQPEVLTGLAAVLTGGGMPRRPRLPEPPPQGQPTEESLPADAVVVEEQPAGAAAPVNGAPPAAPRTPKPPPPEASMNALIQMQINSLLKEAIAAAKANEDPAEFAGWVADQVPPAFEDRVVALAKADDWFTQLFGATPHPDATAHKEWLTKMRDALLEELKEETPS